MAALTYESFTLKEFEKAIAHVEAESLGFIDGEYTFRVSLDGQSGLMIRSTVNAQGFSRPSSKDSIRVWLVDNNDKPLGSKIKRGINRTKGWQNRLNDKMIYLTVRRELVGDCLECDKPIGAFKLKKDKNNLLAKCWDCNNSLGLLSEIKPGTAYFSKVSHGKIEDEPKNNKISAADFIAEMVEVSDKIENPPSEFQLNPEQLLAVNQPIGTDMRVLAGPGAGKTSGVLVPRYSFLVDNGVRPESILAVAFNVNMAKELLEKITASQPNLSIEAQNQICTIDAFFYRTLRIYWKETGQRTLRKYEYNSSRKYIKKPEWLLKDIISDVWTDNEERPNAAEVTNYISNSKFHGLTLDQSKQWFVQRTGLYHGNNLHIARMRYDWAMQAQGNLEFDDMRYLVERLLIENQSFREGLQTRFDEVLIDEAQDVNEQALRILVTVSQNVGWNKIYRGMK